MAFCRLRTRSEAWLFIQTKGSSITVEIERRRHIRLLAQDDAFAALGSRFSRVGRLKNISIKGLAFEYITDGESGQDNSQLKIFVSGNGFHLPKVPCRVVYDIPVRSPKASRIFYQPFITKQCGVQFGPLTEDKMAELNHFLETYTTG